MTELMVRTADGVELYVRDLGEGEAVVSPLACWCEEFEALAAGRRVALYDPRGRGRSSTVAPAQVSFENDIADLDAVREALGLERMSVIGWSYFGGVAARYAMLHPERVRRLVWVGGTPVRGGEFMKAVQAEVTARLRQTDGALMEQIASGAPVTPDLIRRYWEAFSMVRSGDVKPPWPLQRSRPAQHPNERPERIFPLVTRAMQTLGDWDWREEAGRITAAVLLIDGGADILPEQAMAEWAAALPNSETVLLEGVGHFPAYEAPERFFPILEAFLSRG